MSALIAFEFQGNAIRTVMINDRPHWVAVDIAEVLGYSRASNMVRMVPDRQKGAHQVSTLGGMQTLTLLTEGGVYRCVMSSERPEAEAFVDWLTDEVLPSLRATGRYEMAVAESAVEDDLAGGADLLEDLTFERAMTVLNMSRMIHGKRAAARMWAKLGLPDLSEEGQQMAQASAASDPAYACINQWISERCEFVPGHRSQSSALFADYSLWCKTNGQPIDNITRFGRHLGRRGFSSIKLGCIWRSGIMLKPAVRLVS